MTLPCGWASSNQLKDQIEQKKAALPSSKGDLFLPDFKPALKHQLFLGLEPTSLKQELHHQLSWFSGLWTQTGPKPLVLLGF